MPFSCAKKMLIKSVPPVVVPTFKHRLVAKPFKIPPNTLSSKMSSVNIYGGRISTKILDRYNDNNRIQRKSFSNVFISEYRSETCLTGQFNKVYGILIPKKASPISCNNRESPENPPGNSPAVLAKQRKFQA